MALAVADGGSAVGGYFDRLKKEFNLHELAVEDAKHGHQRPKVEEYGQTLFCVLHVLCIDEKNELQVGEIDIFVGPNFILSFRNRSERSLSHVRERCEREPHLLKHGAGYVFYALIDSVVDQYLDVVHKLEDQLEEIEARLFSADSSTKNNIQDLYDLKRKLVTVNHAARPLTEAVGHLYGGRVPQVCVDMGEYYRDINDHLERIVRAVESTRDMLTTALQVNLAMISLEESAVNKKLAGYAALFGVPTMIAGIYGMNFEHMPELKVWWAYPATVISMLVIDLILYWRFKKSKWI